MVEYEGLFAYKENLTNSLLQRWLLVSSAILAAKMYMDKWISYITELQHWSAEQAYKLAKTYRM